MWWSCFSYDHKGPHHIWKEETAAEKATAKAEIDAWNAREEPACKAEWELNTAMRRMGLRNKGGKKPTWKFTAANGAWVRKKGKGGIDAYHYAKHILKPKSLPFAQRVQRHYTSTVYVQEDKAPSHYARENDRIWSFWGMTRLLWPGNSPDLNAIEPCWPWMKSRTTRKGAPQDRKTAEKVWVKAWNELPQDQIRRWIERIPNAIEQIIKLEGGNEYREGRTPETVRPYVSESDNPRGQYNPRKPRLR